MRRFRFPITIIRTGVELLQIKKLKLNILKIKMMKRLKEKMDKKKVITMRKTEDRKKKMK